MTARFNFSLTEVCAVMRRHIEANFELLNVKNIEIYPNGGCSVEVDGGIYLIDKIEEEPEPTSDKKFGGLYTDPR